MESKNKIYTLWKSLIPKENEKNLDVNATFRVNKEQNSFTLTPEKNNTDETRTADCQEDGLALNDDFSGKYIDVEQIGKGGMGIVYKAEDTSLHRKIAIKKILSLKNKKRFIAESIITANLDHPNIVPIYDLDETDPDQVFLTMKLVEGISWKNLLHPKSNEERKIAAQYNVNKHFQILLGVCNAISFAHSKGIIHCDLKPANVMIGSFGEVFVMDWGIAVYTGQSQKKSMVFHRSEISFPMGTPCYMPKELAEGAGDQICEATDVYLLGAILYEILTLKPPHSGNSFWEVLVQLSTKKEFEFPTSTPALLKNICKKALGERPEDRYPTVKEFQTDLEKFIEHSESIEITEIAKENLKECLAEKMKLHRQNSTIDIALYNNFTRTSVSFEKALDLWPENHEARDGLNTTLLEHADLAEKQKDLGLAEIILKQYNKDKNDAEVTKKITEISSLRKGLLVVKEMGLFVFRCALFYFVCVFVIEKMYLENYWKYFAPLFFSVLTLPCFFMQQKITFAKEFKKTNFVSDNPIIYVLLITAIVYTLNFVFSGVYSLHTVAILYACVFSFFFLCGYFEKQANLGLPLLKICFWQSLLFFALLCIVAIDLSRFIQENYSEIAIPLSSSAAMMVAIWKTEVLFDSISSRKNIHYSLLVHTLLLFVIVVTYATFRTYLSMGDNLATGIVILIYVAMGFFTNLFLLPKIKIRIKLEMILTQFFFVMIVFMTLIIPQIFLELFL